MKSTDDHIRPDIASSL